MSHDLKGAINSPIAGNALSSARDKLKKHKASKRHIPDKEIAGKRNLQSAVNYNIENGCGLICDLPFVAFIQQRLILCTDLFRK